MQSFITRHAYISVFAESHLPDLLGVWSHSLDERQSHTLRFGTIHEYFAESSHWTVVYASTSPSKEFTGETTVSSSFNRSQPMLHVSLGNMNDSKVPGRWSGKMRILALPMAGVLKFLMQVLRQLSHDGWTNDSMASSCASSVELSACPIAIRFVATPSFGRSGNDPDDYAAKRAVKAVPYRSYPRGSSKHSPWRGRQYDFLPRGYSQTSGHGLVTN
jgi:hypothetical protein